MTIKIIRTWLDFQMTVLGIQSIDVVDFNCYALLKFDIANMTIQPIPIYIQLNHSNP